MSFCRFSADSDVYVILNVSGHFQCCGCVLDDQRDFTSTDAILAHLQKHIEEGHDVPDYCIERLEAERESNDAWAAELRLEESA